MLPEQQLNKENKIFYSISEVEKITGVQSYVLRYWEKEFKQLNPEKSTTGQRRYRKSNITIILRIKELLYKEGFTIAGANKRLRYNNKETNQLTLDLKEQKTQNIALFIKNELKFIKEVLDRSGKIY